MHPPPHGSGYGPPPQAPGYGPPGYGPPQPPYGPYGSPPPQKSGPSGLVIAILVIVVLLVLAGGGCLVLTLVAVSASSSSSAETEPSTSTEPAGESTVDRTPLAIQLEGALRKDGVPFDHVECPLNPPSSGAFSCAVLPAGVGDPAELTVTRGANGMAYKLQEGFVILDGAKLASTFAGIAGLRALTVPCFKGKILKHADTDFTCDVQSAGAVVGHVTTSVIGQAGDVKMDYEPIAKGKVAKAGGAQDSIDGRYACSMMSAVGGVVQFVPSALPPFTISGGQYNSGGKDGRIRTSGTQIVMFLDGPYDGWYGLLQSGRTIVFRGKDHEDAQPGVAMKVGDFRCVAR